MVAPDARTLPANDGRLRPLGVRKDKTIAHGTQSRGVYLGRLVARVYSIGYAYPHSQILSVSKPDPMRADEGMLT